MTDQEKSAIKNILQSPQWKFVEAVAERIIQNIRNESNLRDSEWETAKATALEEGQVNGIKRFIKELYENAG